MRLTHKQKIDKTIRWLRANFVPEKPFYGVRVYTRHAILPKEGVYQIYGDSEFKNGYFLIRIHTKATAAIKLDVLWHEWAHVMTWFECSREDHPNVFGEAYARIYRAWLKWDYGRGET